MSSTADQDLEWDIVLVVGEDHAQIHASSQLLCVASKPFSKMLGPHFKEGQPHAACTEKEIPLPADKPSAIRIMCNIIHHQIDGTGPVPTAAELCDLAIVADKYDCTRATGLAAKAWIQPISVHDTCDLGLLLISASIYALPEAYYKISASLVLGHGGSYQELAKVPGFIDRLGWEIILKLEEKRSFIRYEINKELALSLKCPSCSWKCDWSAQQLRRWFEHLYEKDLLPVVNSEKLSSVISRAECSATSDMDTDSQCQSARWHRGVDLRMRKDSLTKVQDTSGVHLEC